MTSVEGRANTPCDKSEISTTVEMHTRRQCEGGLEKIKIGVRKNSWEPIETISVRGDECLS